MQVIQAEAKVSRRLRHLIYFILTDDEVNTSCKCFTCLVFCEEFFCLIVTLTAFSHVMFSVSVMEYLAVLLLAVTFLVTFCRRVLVIVKTEVIPKWTVKQCFICSS